MPYLTNSGPGLERLAPLSSSTTNIQRNPVNGHSLLEAPSIGLGFSKVLRSISNEKAEHYM